MSKMKSQKSKAKRAKLASILSGASMSNDPGKLTLPVGSTSSIEQRSDDIRISVDKVKTQPPAEEEERGRH